MRRPTPALALALLAGCFPEIDLSGVSKGGVWADDTASPTDDTGGGDADTDTDDPELCTVFTDADGDGFGDPATELELPCAEVPEGAVDQGDDCDDTRADIFPGAPERCDEADNDCDGTVDEDLEYDWYTDSDGDGFGDAAARVETCDPGEGLVADATDCDDARADTFPGADELCDDADNDCDLEVDEDAIDRSSWHADADADGFGDPGDATLSCDPVEGRVLDASDCDDTDAAISPDATEVCDERDNDCDGTLDDADASLDPTSTATWYADTDLDGYGDAASTAQACAQPSGYVDNDGDCDDTNMGISPDASESCNTIDDDCDGLVDDADDSLDPATAAVFFADIDGDGYGDALNTTHACIQPSDYLTDDQDCDDLTASINPAATEVCDALDNDCDGDVDDADADLDLSTAATWYEDADADGLGNAAVTDAACDQPLGFVDNGTDCDDTDATDAADLDSDGTPDCGDDDIDGDGLRNDWDVDPEDDSLARGPTAGFGGDGAASVSGDVEQTAWTVAAAGVAAGGTTIAVDDSGAFAFGDEVLVLSQMGTDAGQHQFVFVSAVGTGTLTVEPPLSDAYAAGSVVLVQRVPHYTTATISGRLNASPWTGDGGGVVVFRATGAVTISGDVEAQGVGFFGGEGVSGNGSAGTQGDSMLSFGAVGTPGANDGGGGTYPLSSNGCDGGAGAGHGTAGSAGYGLYCSSTEWWGCSGYGLVAVTTGGATYGDADLVEWHLGSGGGAGAPDSGGDGYDGRNISGDGGGGGGIVAIYSGTSISVSGQIDADGEDGEDGQTYGGEVGAGGGGAGGTILLAAPVLSFTGDIEARGKDGGTGEDYNQQRSYRSADCGLGGDGGDGRVRLEYTTISGVGNVDPAPGSTAAYTP